VGVTAMSAAAAAGGATPERCPRSRSMGASPMGVFRTASAAAEQAQGGGGGLLAGAPPSRRRSVITAKHAEGYLLPGDPREAIACEIHGLTCQSMHGEMLEGSLFLTTYRLLFLHVVAVEDEAGALVDSAMALQIPLFCVHKVTPKKRKLDDRSVEQMKVNCKDCRVVKFFVGSSDTQALKAFAALFAQAEKEIDDLKGAGVRLFAVQYREVFDADGWEHYDATREFKRQGAFAENSLWRETEANAEFRLCPTYPKTLLVPKCFDDADLQLVSRFRSKYRIPALSWMHPASGGAILRCSQPLVGMTGSRNADDERLMEVVATMNMDSQDVLIFDARSKVNAQANRARKGGYEDDARYTKQGTFSSTLIFMDIGNIHVMRDSLETLHALFCSSKSSDVEWSKQVDESDWLSYVQKCWRGRAT